MRYREVSASARLYRDNQDRAYGIAGTSWDLVNTSSSTHLRPSMEMIMTRVVSPVRSSR